MALFESYERRVDHINEVIAQYGIKSIEECRQICNDHGFDPYDIVKSIQPIAFDNAGWAYTVGAAIAIKKGVKTAAEAAEAIGIGLQSFCIAGSVADDRKVGIGHGNLGAMLLRDETKCFAFLAGHESFAAAEGAIGIVKNANKARKEPLRVILNGLGKDAAQIISRINGFTYVQTQFDYYTGKLNIVREIAYSKGERAAVRCYGADDVRDWPRDVLRDQFGMVLQDTWLFEGTVAQNIAYGAGTDEVDMDKVRMCSKLACADHFIETLPRGYDFVINEEASNISQGEKQLITIARAFMSNPRILILDEATSNVDTRTERLVQQAMEKLMEGRTSFIIAHRLSTIRDANLILVMEKGNIVEQGTHEELLERKSFYYNLYMSQFKGVSDF